MQKKPVGGVYNPQISPNDRFMIGFTTLYVQSYVHDCYSQSPMALGEFGDDDLHIARSNLVVQLVEIPVVVCTIEPTLHV